MDKRAIVSCLIIYIMIIGLTNLVFVESDEIKDPCWVTCGTVCAIYHAGATTDYCKKECSNTCTGDNTIIKNCEPVCEKSCKVFNPKFTEDSCKKQCDDICKNRR
ncbi:hypothetical protein M5689_009719 [Euphorbia peplus]|nr:hypothetical protein M5689_009719 [Euphorbia peplus]